MTINELKCTEILIRSLVNGSDLRTEILAEFRDIDTFEKTKNNLFSIISINNFLERFDGSLPFSLDEFMETGRIPGMYDDKVTTPSTDIRYVDDNQAFFKYLVEALREDNYLFDENNNLFVSSEKLETSIDKNWFYRLSESCDRDEYQRVYFFNKNPNYTIFDRRSLEEYLRQTKTFLVTLTSEKENYFGREFTKAEKLTNESLKDLPTVKVAQVMDTFQSFVSPQYSAKTSKYKLTDYYWILNKADMMGDTFYKAPLETQQKYINKWVTEYLNSIKIANSDTQKYILLSSLNNKYKLDKEEISKNNVLIGLFNLYVSLIEKLGLDFYDISLSDFKINEYSSESFQDAARKIPELASNIERLKDAKQIIKKSIDDSQLQLNTTNFQDTEKLSDIMREYRGLVEQYKEIDHTESEYQKEYNRVQDTLRTTRDSGVEELQFDNKRIFELICKASKEGIIHLVDHGKALSIELQNHELGRTYFRATIKLQKLICFIENLNYSLEDELFVDTRNNNR
jgi:hypothetical protein